MQKSAFLLAAALMLAGSGGLAHAQTPDPIPGVRHMRDVPGAGEPPDPRLDYRIVFDMKTLADSPDEVAPDLEFVAGLINTFHASGVPAQHMHLVAVFHGATIVQLADDSTYRQRTGVASNPNTALLAKLRGAGVKLTVCGQSALGQHYDLAMLSRAAQVNLSATVTFINLGMRGYVRVDD